MSAAIDILKKSDFSVARAVSDALRAIATQELGDKLLRMALLQSGWQKVPEDFRKASSFIAGPLKETLQKQVGDHIAQLLLETLRPILEHGEAAEQLKLIEESAPIFQKFLDETDSVSGVRIRIQTISCPDDIDLESLRPEDSLGLGRKAMEEGLIESMPNLAVGASLSPESLQPSASEVVVLVSEDPMGFDGLAQFVTDYAELRAYPNIDSLLADLPNLQTRRLAIILDESMRRVTSPMSTFLSKVLPRGSSVVLWGGSGPAEHATTKELRFFECPLHANYEEVAYCAIEALQVA